MARAFMQCSEWLQACTKDTMTMNCLACFKLLLKDTARWWSWSHLVLSLSFIHDCANYTFHRPVTDVKYHFYATKSLGSCNHHWLYAGNEHNVLWMLGLCWCELMCRFIALELLRAGDDELQVLISSQKLYFIGRNYDVMLLVPFDELLHCQCISRG